MTYTFSIANDTLSAKVDADSLAVAIRASTIATALDYISTAGDDLHIVFKDDLSVADGNALIAIVAAHPGAPIVDKTKTSEEIPRFTLRTDVDLVTARKTAVRTVDGQEVYVNLCDLALFPVDGSGLVLEWIPTEGKRLEVKSTQLTTTPNVPMDKKLEFVLVNCGKAGTTNKTLTYNELFDYIAEGISMELSAEHRKISWIYEPSPIIVCAKHGGKIQIRQPLGAQSGSQARVKLTYGVVDDT